MPTADASMLCCMCPAHPGTAAILAPKHCVLLRRAANRWWLQVPDTFGCILYCEAEQRVQRQAEVCVLNCKPASPLPSHMRCTPAGQRVKKIFLSLLLQLALFPAGARIPGAPAVQPTMP